MLHAEPLARGLWGVVRAVTAEATGLPVVVGLQALDTPSAVAAVERLAGQSRCGTQAFMVQVNTDDPDALAEHFTAIHEATGAGIVVRDYPAASKTEISSARMAKAISVGVL